MTGQRNMTTVSPPDERGVARHEPARLGLILPMDNAVLEPEYAALQLTEATTHAARLTTDERDDMPTNGIEISAVFNELGVDAIGYACAETSFLGGIDANAYISREITRVTGRPAVTAIAAMVEALTALSASRVAVAAPYRESSAVALTDYLVSVGVDVVALEHRDFSEQSSDPREWFETNRQPPQTAYDMATRVDTSEAECIVIAATNLRSLSVLPRLEATLGKPVISTNSALLWALLERAGITSPRLDRGRLVAGVAPSEGGSA